MPHAPTATDLLLDSARDTDVQPLPQSLDHLVYTPVDKSASSPAYVQSNAMPGEQEDGGQRVSEAGTTATPAQAFTRDLSPNISTRPMPKSDHSDDNSRAEKIAGLQQLVEDAKKDLHRLQKETGHAKAAMRERTHQIDADVTKMLNAAAESIAENDRKEQRQISELHTAAEQKMAEAAMIKTTIQNAESEKIKHLLEQKKLLQHGNDQEAEQAFQERLNRAKIAMTAQRNEIESRIQHTNEALEKAQADVKGTRAESEKRVHNLRQEVATIRRQAVATIARSERALAQRISNAENTAADQHAVMGRTAEQQATALAEMQLAEAKALFDEKVVQAQHEAQLELERVNQEAAEEKEHAYSEMVGARADVETKIAEAEKTEADRVAQAQKQADEKVQAAIATISKVAEEKVAAAEERELQKMAHIQRLSGSKVHDIRRSAEHHSVEATEKELAQGLASFEEQMKSTQIHLNSRVADTEEAATAQAEAARLEMAKMKHQMQLKIAEAKKRETERVLQAQTEANKRVEDGISRIQAQTLERIKDAENRERQRLEEVQKDADARILEATKTAEEEIKKLQNDAEKKITKISDELKTSLGGDNGNREERIMGILDSIQLLEKVPASKKRILGKAMDIKTFQDGEAIITEGDIGDAFYILEEGSVRVTQKTAGEGADRVLTTLMAGSNFGELALINKAPRKASILAIQTVVVLELKSEDFQAIIGSMMSLIKFTQWSTPGQDYQPDKKFQYLWDQLRKEVEIKQLAAPPGKLESTAVCCRNKLVVSK